MKRAAWRILETVCYSILRCRWRRFCSWLLYGEFWADARGDEQTSDKYPVDSDKLQRYLSDAARSAHIAAASMADAVRAYRNARPPKLPRKTWRSREVGRDE